MPKTPINEIMIIGNDLPIDSELKELSSREGVLCIGDGASDVTLELIKEKLQDVTLADNVRIDINAHGGRNEQKQHRIFGVKAEGFLEDLKDILVQHSGKQELVAEWHLWSCYGGSSNKAAHILGKGNTLVTHVNSKNTSLEALENYTNKKSLENYLENPNKDIYTRWVEEQKYSFQTSTFNFNPTSDPKDTIHLKTARTLKPETLKDVVKKFKHTNDLTVVFTDFIAEDIRKIENNREFKKAKELRYFKSNFKESDETKIELSDEEAKNLALGIAIYLSNNNIKNPDLFKEYIPVIQRNEVDLNSIVLGVTPLYIATHKGHIEIVETLLEHGAEVDKTDKDKGITPLWIAAQEGHIEIVGTLLEHGAEVDKTDKDKGITPLWIAAQEGHIEIVGTLLEHGAKVDKTDEYKCIAPLWTAAQNGHVEVVEKLLEKG